METPSSDAPATPPLELEAPPSNGRDSHPPKRARRKFTEQEQRAMVTKYLKSGLGPRLGAKSLDLQESVLRRWVDRFGIPTPSTKKAAPRVQAKPAKKTARQGLHTDAQKIKALERWEKGANLKDLAEKMDVHQDSIRGWWQKFRKGASPRFHAAKKKAAAAANPHAHGKGTTKRHWDFDVKRKAVARIGTEKRIDIQAELGISSGMMSNWIDEVARGEKKIARAEKKAAKLAERDFNHGAIVPVEMSPTNGPKGNLHDVIVYLRLQRDAANKAVRLGLASVDNPLIVFSMLALNSAGGGGA